MKLTIISIILVLTSYLSVAQQCNSSSCSYTVTGNNSTANNINLNGNQTMCITGDVTLSNFNVNGNNNTICIKTGVTATTSNNLSNTMTINVYGTFNFSGNINNPSNFTFNVYSGGTLNLTSGSEIKGLIINNNSGATVNINNSGAKLVQSTIYNSGTFNYAGGELNQITLSNSGNFNLTNTGTVTFQNSTSITNAAGGTITGTAPSKVMVNQGTFTNNGTATFTNLENQEGNFTNNTGAILTFQQGTFQHGALHNYGSIIVNCGNGFSSNCSNACMKLGNKNAGQFTNDGALTVHGSVCVGAGVIFHNNGTTTVDGNMNLENSNSQWVQGSGGSTTVGGTTTTNGGTFSGGTLCSPTVNGTVGSTISCGGTPAIISDLTASTCKAVSITISIPATAPSGATVSWSTLKLINAQDTVSATSANHTLTTTNGTYTTSYTSSAASVLFVPASTFTGSTSIKYRIAAISGSTTSYAAPKDITVTVSAPPTKPQFLIATP